MQKGKVAWFSSGKGSGFIALEGSVEDIYINIKQLGVQVLKPRRVVKMPNMKQLKARAIDRVSQNILYYNYKAQLVSKNCSKILVKKC